MTAPAAPPARHRDPWGQTTITVSLGIQLLTFGVLGWAFVQARYEATVPDQEPWAVLAVLAAVLSGAANGWWLLTGRRALAQRRQRLFGRGRGAPVGPRIAEPDALVAAAEMTRYHRAGCTLAHGKAVLGAPRSSHEAAGRRPCDWCRP